MMFSLLRVIYCDVVIHELEVSFFYCRSLYFAKKIQHVCIRLMVIYCNVVIHELEGSFL